MKRFNYLGTVIEAFQFNGSLDLQTYPRDGIPPVWFGNGYHNNDFCEVRDEFNPGNQALHHCDPSMVVQTCRIGDWVAYDPERADIGVFFIQANTFDREATEFSDTVFTSLKDANIARQKEWDSAGELSLSFKGNELAGETGELCNVIKKLEREKLGLPGSRDTVEHAAEEMADVVICIDLLATHLGVDLWQAVAKKFNATSEKNGMKTRLVIPNG